MSSSQESFSAHPAPAQVPVPSHAEVANIEAGMDMMSDGEMPELPDDSTVGQERGMLHLHMLAEQYRAEEVDATGEEDYERLMGQALEAEHQADAYDNRRPVDDNRGRAARLRGEATARVHRSVRGRALESRYSVVLQARDSMLPGYVWDPTVGARAIAQVRKRSRVQQEQDEA